MFLNFELVRFSSLLIQIERSYILYQNIENAISLKDLTKKI
jgi:hypothetical protein